MGELIQKQVPSVEALTGALPAKVSMPQRRIVARRAVAGKVGGVRLQLGHGEK